ncbi:MAG: DsbA family protein [Alphaproteobacteria bacterium]|nr:DsbA family protein [Alphaproteobacteria bacterium]
MTKLSWALMAAVVLLFSGTSGLHAGEASLPDHVLGKKDAPVTIQEFASLTCSHCAEFTVDILPQIEKRYVETGKVKFIFHDFPLDGVALKAAAVARCMPAEQYYPFINVLFKNLQQWTLSKDPEKTIVQYAKLGGLPEEKALACIKDSKMLDALVAERTEAQRKYSIDATPTFVFNDGKEKLVGARKLEEFTAVIDRLLAEKK